MEVSKVYNDKTFMIIIYKLLDSLSKLKAICTSNKLIVNINICPLVVNTSCT